MVTQTQGFIRSIVVLAVLVLVACYLWAASQPPAILDPAGTFDPATYQPARSYEHMRDWTRFYNLVVSQDIKLPQEAVIISAIETSGTKGGSYEVKFRLPQTRTPHQWLQVMADVSHLPFNKDDPETTGSIIMDLNYRLSLDCEDRIQYYSVSCTWQGQHQPRLSRTTSTLTP